MYDKEKLWDAIYFLCKQNLKLKKTKREDIVKKCNFVFFLIDNDLYIALNAYLNGDAFYFKIPIFPSSFTFLKDKKTESIKEILSFLKFAEHFYYRFYLNENDYCLFMNRNENNNIGYAIETKDCLYPYIKIITDEYQDIKRIWRESSTINGFKDYFQIPLFALENPQKLLNLNLNIGNLAQNISRCISKKDLLSQEALKYKDNYHYKRIFEDGRIERRILTKNIKIEPQTHHSGYNDITNKLTIKYNYFQLDCREQTAFAPNRTQFEYNLKNDIRETVYSKRLIYDKCYYHHEGEIESFIFEFYHNLLLSEKKEIFNIFEEIQLTFEDSEFGDFCYVTINTKGKKGDCFKDKLYIKDKVYFVKA